MIKRIRLRTLLFGGIMTLLFVVLIGRLFFVQVIDDSYYAMAKQRWAASEVLPAKRGSITDRYGNLLAMDTIAYNISVNPRVINEAGIQKEVIDGLSETLGISRDYVEDAVMAQKEDGQFYGQRELRKGGWQIEKAVAEEVMQLRDELSARLLKEKRGSDSGIIIQETLKRFYPRYNLASQVVGYVSPDKERMTGAEAYFNDKLSGEDGYMRYEKDGKLVQLTGSEVDYKPAKDGYDIALTIDYDIQFYVEEALRDIVKQYNPKSATAIAADPNTMEILALANMPDFDPNEYWKSGNESFYNHAVWSLYEPGSTSKIMTLAAAVEEGVFDPNEEYHSGSIVVKGDPKPIRDHNKVGWGTITYLDGLKYSSNVAFVKLGFERLGGEKLREYFTNFGFGQKTGIEMSNELAGTIRFQWNRDIAAAAFGQGEILVTPIQQVAAVAAVANGGKLMQPHIVKSMTDPVTKTTTVTEPKLVRRVISEETSRKVNEYLEQVVSDQEKGTGRNAYIEGYRVAGKTGTAQKVIGGNYSADKFLVSFIGYAPVEDPKIVVYILVDEPNDPTAGGGRVAAPAFREIVLKSLRKMGVAPSRTADEEAGGEVTVTVPDLTGMKIPAAKAKLKAEGTSFELVGDGGAVLRQIPSPGTAVHPTQKLYLITEQADRLAVPDLTGVSLRDAAELTSLIGARLVYEGSGYVISQKVTEKDGKRLISVVLSPPEGAEGYIDPESLPAGDEEAAEQTENPEGEAADGAGDGGTADGGDGET